MLQCVKLAAMTADRQTLTARRTEWPMLAGTVQCVCVAETRRDAGGEATGCDRERWPSWPRSREV